MNPLFQVISSVAVSAFVSFLFFSSFFAQKLNFAEAELHSVAQVERQRIEAAREEALARIAEERSRPLVMAPEPLALPPELDAARPLQVDKNAAWAAWYQVPEQCGLNVSDGDFVGCVNHKMRAKKEFERLWAQDPAALGRAGGG